MTSNYSWESFIRIHGGESGARDVFDKMIDELLRAENPDKEVHIVKASRGDGGIDIYIHQEDGIDIYQCKFFMGTLNSSRWSQIKESFIKAMEPKGVKVLRWYLCMPREMQKEDIEKWDKFREENGFFGAELRCIDGNEIISRLEKCDRLKNTALIDKYFHENRTNNYSWESFIRIHGGEPGARDVFDKMIDELLRAENPDKEVHIVKASWGDGGIDIYIHQEDGIDIYQCKFFMGTLNSSRWSQIKEAFRKAMGPKGVKVLRWYLCMPREMQKEDIEKWDKFREENEFFGVELRCIDGKEIIFRMEECDRLKNTALIDKYFHEDRTKHFTNKDLIIPFTMSKANGTQGGTYVPRDDLLDKIEECFKTERIVFLSGMRGCGKSELARSYGYEHRDDYEEIFWLTCDDGVTPDFLRLMDNADLLCKIEKSDTEGFSNKVLIIVDNCNSDAPAFLGDLENWTGDAMILITTRLSHMGDYNTIIPVESDDPELFAYTIFERNYCKKPKWGRAKILQEEDAYAVRAICAAVQYNAMFVSLIAIRLREYSNLSIPECAEKMRRGIGEIEGEIKYEKDQRTRSAEMKDILKAIFGDILNYPFSDAQKAVLTVLSLTPATWYEIDFICYLLGNMSNEYAVGQLLDYGWLQGGGDKMAIHPLIAEVISDQPILIKESEFFEGVLENYLCLPDEYMGKERFLINKVLNIACDASPDTRVAVMLVINHGGYRKLFKENHPRVQAAYFVYLNHKGKRYFEYRDLVENETHSLSEVVCHQYEAEHAALLDVYNTGIHYTLDLNVYFHGIWILEIPDGFRSKDIFLSKCLFNEYIVSIGKDAFLGCRKLQGELNLPDSLKSIGDFAFYGCSGLSGELKLPKSLASIGDYAFSGCSGLSGELKLPEGLKSIGDYAFSGCSGLSGELKLPEGLESVGDYAFSGYSGLSGELKLPEGLASIGDFAFYGCSGLSGELKFPEGLTSLGGNNFTGDRSLSGELKLPEGLTSIGDYAFYGYSGLSGELKLPEGLESIGDFAFYGCSGLSGELKLPVSLESIGDFAFCGCSGLSGELKLPKSLTRIGDRVFSGCNGLSGELKLPESLESIGESAFSGCSGLSGELKLPGGLRGIGNYAFSGCRSLSGELKLPESLTSIGDYAFSGCSGLSGELKLRESLTSIGDYAFSGCSGFSGELKLPEGLASIGKNAFSGCSGLSGELKLPEGLMSIRDWAFSECSGLSGELKLPERLTSIGDNAFSGCSSLSGELKLPERLTSIGDSAFYGCSGLSGELKLPECLVNIGDQAFYGCSGLNGELKLPECLVSIGSRAFYGCSGLIGELKLPESLKSIGASAFYRCSGLSGELKLPESVASIGSFAFYVCSGLSGELRLPESLTSIEASAFSGCSGLSGELRLPESLTSIEASAFSGCSGLSGELYLPSGLTSIGDGAFENCSGLSGEFHFPDSLTNIGNYAFSGCSSLIGELYLPPNLTKIEEFAFSGCRGLIGGLHLPESVTSIGNSAFSGCKGLNGELYLPSSLISIGDSAFEECSGLSGELHFPDSLTSIGNYAFSGCSGLCGRVNLPINLMSIGARLFYGCNSLSGELHLPSSLTKIGEFAFSGCEGLTGALHFPESVTSIGASAFSRCSGLSGELYLPSGLTSIGDGAFENCSSLSGEFHFPDSLTSIGNYAFSGCRGLRGELYFPDGLRSIGNYAFSGCRGLSGELHFPNSLISIGVGAFKSCYGLMLLSCMPDTIEKIGIGAFDGLNTSEDILDFPAAIRNRKLVRETGILEIEYEQIGLIGRYYIRIDDSDVVTYQKIGNESTAVSLRIPSIYSYVYSILKDKLYYARLDRDNVYDVLKATGSQSRRKYAKQLIGNHNSNVLLNWYIRKKPAVGDYVIMSIYDDNEIVLDYISKNEQTVIQKYGLEGNQGNLTFKNEIKETGVDFRLVSLVVRDGQRLIMDYSFFPEEIVKSGTEPVTTIIVGENGSGKSHTLKILTEIFCAVENDNPRNLLTYTYYKLVYTLKGKRISIEIAQNRVGIHDGKRLLDRGDAKKVLPNKVLALAFMLNDKYIFRRDISENSIYEYLGVRGASNAAWTSALGNRVAENIISLVSEGALWNIINRLSEYLHIDSKISITVEVKEKRFVEHGFSFTNIQKFILDGLKKESIENSSSQRIIQAKNRVTESIESYSNTLYSLLHANAITKGDIHVCEIVFDEKDIDFKIGENEKTYNAVLDLYLLQIVSNTTLYIYRDGQKYMFDEVSSGEKNILYAILNIAGHIEKNSLVMIDEPEISLHPNWQMLYVSLLKTVFKDYSTCHFLIATHSPYMVSDLNPDSSSLIALYNNHGDRKMQTIDYSTYAWSVENILYSIFHVRTTRNYYFELDLRELIKLVGDNENKDTARIKELYEKLSRYVFDQNDPLRLILKQVKEQFIDAES